jgi:radical SAM superfamily enzyme YgiQ (UPF0313 family)
MKKRVYLVQASNILSNSVFLPYSVGALAAYSWQFSDIREEYLLSDFIFTKKPVEEVLSEMESPFLVGFSNYMWNVEYNLVLAAAIKKKWHDCIIVFGGTQVPNDKSFLKEYSFIDILIHGEGEEILCALLRKLSASQSFDDVPNISYRDNEKIIKNKEQCPGDISSYPSPYAEGYFDKIVNDERYKGMQFDAIIETNRGCPYKCVYCAWSLSNASFRKFPVEKTKSELLWLAEHKIPYCICADANFGILDRDETIVDYLVALNGKYGYPQKFETTAAKNKDELTFRINMKLHKANLNKGVSLACQSLSPAVLKNIGRENMDIGYFSSQLKRYRDAGMHTYTDLILGLPGETFNSFCSGLFAVIEAGQHNSININKCELLPNSIMYEKGFIEKYHIKTIRSVLCQNHSEVTYDNSIGSRSQIVVETDTMSRDEWLNACRISTCAQSFHCMGLLRFFAVYLRKAKNISYESFYMSFYRWIETESKTVKTTLDYVMKCFDAFLMGKGNIEFSDERFGNIYWPCEEALFLCCVVETEKFYDEVCGFLRTYFDDDVLFTDLLKYQKNIITALDCEPKKLKFLYDWQNYFADIYDTASSMPEKKNNILVIRNENGVNNLQDYAKKIVWYGKRDNRAIVQNVEQIFQ